MVYQGAEEAEAQHGHISYQGGDRPPDKKRVGGAGLQSCLAGLQRYSTAVCNPVVFLIADVLKAILSWQNCGAYLRCIWERLQGCSRAACGFQRCGFYFALSFTARLVGGRWFACRCTQSSEHVGAREQPRRVFRHHALQTSGATKIQHAGRWGLSGSSARYLRANKTNCLYTSI